MPGYGAGVDCIDHGGYGGYARCVEALLLLLHDPVPHIRRAVWHTLFCERCPDTTKCEIATPVPLDRVALLIEIGANDPNAKLRRQLVGELGNHVSDPRARQVLEEIVDIESDPHLLPVAQRALAQGAHLCAGCVKVSYRVVEKALLSSPAAQPGAGVDAAERPKIAAFLSARYTRP
jgi:hypothetical protein